MNSWSFLYLQICGLKTRILVCDGGAPNLAALKTSHRCFEAYRNIANRVLCDQHIIKLWFTNLFNPPRRIYWLICPTHQVQNITIV